MDWCKGPDAGLPKPDLVLLLSISSEAMKSRGGFGEERYEKEEIQRKVMEIFRNLKDFTWKVCTDLWNKAIAREVWGVQPTPLKFRNVFIFITKQ